ncbi:uncharacterized protein [Henckelia pumila]|uniref:uncharacterized protein n=1 Tax=Henckelia pumila TaxID=405737 RepID=UPI003C6E9FC1
MEHPPLFCWVNAQVMNNAEHINRWMDPFSNLLRCYLIAKLLASKGMFSNEGRENDLRSPPHHEPHQMLVMEQVPNDPKSPSHREPFVTLAKRSLESRQMKKRLLMQFRSHHHIVSHSSLRKKIMKKRLYILHSNYDGRHPLNIVWRRSRR